MSRDLVQALVEALASMEPDEQVALIDEINDGLAATGTGVVLSLKPARGLLGRPVQHRARRMACDVPAFDNNRQSSAAETLAALRSLRAPGPPTPPVEMIEQLPSLEERTKACFDQMRAALGRGYARGHGKLKL